MKFPFFSFLKRRPRKVYSPLTTAEIQKLVAPIVERKLLPMGFELQKPLRWAEGGSKPIRKMFGLMHFKGHSLLPSWGFSLDYVPHISGSQVKWHRTVRSALLDLRVDARDPRMNMSHIWGAEQFLDQMPIAVDLALESAEKFWDSVSCVADLPAAFEATRKHYGGGGLGFYNFVQHPIAYAFTLAKLGETERARGELQKFFYFEDPETNSAICDRISALFEEVCRRQSVE